MKEIRQIHVDYCTEEITLSAICAELPSQGTALEAIALLHQFLKGIEELMAHVVQVSVRQTESGGWRSSVHLICEEGAEDRLPNYFDAQG